MSTIAGVVSLAESPEQVAACFDLVFQSLAHRAGSPERWQNHQCSLGARVPRGLCDGLEKSHAVHAPTGCAIVFDGRLDNRDELIAQLPELPSGVGAGLAPPYLSNSPAAAGLIEKDGASPAPTPDVSDAEIVLHAYLHWAEDCAAKLLGDFAFAVWDPRTRSLYAARDPLGVRPFFYTVNSDRLGFASEFKALLSLPGVTRTPDDYMVSEFLLWWSSFPDISHTFFRDVSRLLPAHWMRWNAKGLELHRYWAIDPHRRIRYKQHQQYVEEFESLLTKAVAARLRGCRKVGVFLSGGMDSSAVATLCGRLKDSPADVYAYSFQIPDENDESHLAELVARNAGITFRRHPMPLEDAMHRVESYIREIAIPFVSAGALAERDLLEVIVEDGCGAILTGDGSDELFNYPWAYVADLVRSFQIGRLIRESGPLARYHGRRHFELFMLASRYLTPSTLKRTWKFLKWRQAPAWLNADFAQRTGLISRLRWLPPRLPFDSLSTDEVHFAMTRGRRVLADEHRDAQTAATGLHFRYPYYDCRLLELMYAVPWLDKNSGGRVKSFLQESPGLLPPQIANLRAKANYLPYSLKQTDVQQWRSLQPLFDCPPPLAAEFVNLDSARHIYRAFVHNGNARYENACIVLGSFLVWLKTSVEQDQRPAQRVPNP